MNGVFLQCPWRRKFNRMAHTSVKNFQSNWVLSLQWLACLAPFFYLTYGLANHWAASRTQVASVVFAWERHIPFVAWTIIPYWTLNVFYGLSLFLPTSRQAIHVLGLRLLTAQCIAVSCFVLYPLSFTFVKPSLIEGLAGKFFAVLAGFDQPYNQAPSLHITLVILLWPTYWTALPARWRPVLSIWFGLIILSVLTTYQHHFIDIPTGVLLGLLCLWLYPDAPLAAPFSQPIRPVPRLAYCYAAGAACFALLAYSTGGLGLLLFYPAVSLSLIALAYAKLGAVIFQKNAVGQQSIAVRCLLAPYRWAAYWNSCFWLRHQPLSVPVIDGVHLGSIRAPACQAMLDMCAELNASHPPIHYRCVPMLDLVVPTVQQLNRAVVALEELRQQGEVLVCCALGYSRSAAVVVAWLVHTKRSPDINSAVSLLKKSRPQLLLSPAHFMAIAESVLCLQKN